MVENARIGIVDMGSNAIRFQVAEATAGAHQILESHRLPVRLGLAVFQTGQIPEAAMTDAVDAFRRFRTTCDRLGVARIRAIATSAMRDAKNREMMIDRVREACGIDIEIISGTQEAYLLKLGVETRLDLSSGRSLLVDVGGGSVEVVLVENGDVSGVDSYRLGALRMLEAFREAASNGDESFVELLQKHLRGLDHRIAERLDEGRIDRYIAVGGNIESLSDLVAEKAGPRKKDGIDACALADLEDEVLDLAELSYDDRMNRRGLRADRADTIVPAGIVYAHLGNLAKVDHVLVPRAGIKDGLMVEVVHGHFESFAAEDHVDVVLGSCRAMGKRFHYEAEHAEAVLTLSRQLFDQTAELHGLDKNARVLLEAAALLHDVGVTINNDGHHKHSQYLIESTELVGLSDDERHLVALIARYHRKAAPTRDHVAYMALRRRDRARVERLAAVLRLADALDRQHSQVVRGVEARITGDAVELRPRIAEGAPTRLTLEAKAVAAKGALFAQLFGKRPVMILP